MGELLQLGKAQALPCGEGDAWSWSRKERKLLGSDPVQVVTACLLAQTSSEQMWRSLRMLAIATLTRTLLLSGTTRSPVTGAEGLRASEEVRGGLLAEDILYRTDTVALGGGSAAARQHGAAPRAAAGLTAAGGDEGELPERWCFLPTGIDCSAEEVRAWPIREAPDRSAAVVGCLEAGAPPGPAGC